jgi:hypothetical protein
LLSLQYSFVVLFPLFQSFLVSFEFYFSYLSFLCHLQLFLVSIQLIQPVLLSLQLFQSAIFCSVLVNSINFAQSSVYCSVVSVIFILLSHSFKRGSPLCVGLFCFSHIQSVLLQSYLLSHPSQSSFFFIWFFSYLVLLSLLFSVLFLQLISYF